MSSLGQLLIETITHAEPSVRDQSVRALAAPAGLSAKLQACAELEHFRRNCQNLYERVRASLFLHALLRYEIQDDPALAATGLIPFSGFMDLMERRYESAITGFATAMATAGPNGAICSALAQAYEQVAFQTLADQVRRSVRSCQGNRWMFRVGSAAEHPLRIHPGLLAGGASDRLFPILEERCERTPNEALVDGDFATKSAIDQADQRGCTVYGPIKAEEKKRAAGKILTPAARGIAMRLPRGGAEWGPRPRS
jgi:hypothetical protein